MTTANRVAVVGQGYVGLPLAMRAVSAGFTVVGLDVDAVTVEALRDGRSHIEDVPDQTVRAALATGRYLPTNAYADAADFETAVIAVPTPLRDARPDLSFVEAAVVGLAPLITKGALVVLESTTYPGTTERLVTPGLATLSGLVPGTDFLVAYSPERIDPGNPVWRFENIPKLVAGIDAASLVAVRTFYTALVDTVVEVADTKVAEFAKLLENTFRHVNIALVNEMALFAREMDIDIWRVIDAAATKPFGFTSFTPGPGVGGHCLPVDPSYLSWEVQRRVGRTSRFVELANDVNDRMPEYVVRRLVDGLNRRGRAMNGSHVLIVGVAYKANTRDVRESPTVRIVARLQALGAEVLVVDPLVSERDIPSGTRLVDLDRSVVDGVDAVVVLTAHDGIDYDVLCDGDIYVLDTQRVLPLGDAELL